MILHHIHFILHYIPSIEHKVGHDYNCMAVPVTHYIHQASAIKIFEFGTFTRHEVMKFQGVKISANMWPVQSTHIFLQIFPFVKGTCRNWKRLVQFSKHVLFLIPSLCCMCWVFFHAMSWLNPWRPHALGHWETQKNWWAFCGPKTPPTQATNPDLQRHQRLLYRLPTMAPDLQASLAPWHPLLYRWVFWKNDA